MTKVNLSTEKIDFRKLFLSRLQSLMEQRGIDQKQISDGTRLSPAAIHKYLKKGAMPGSIEMAKLADFFGVSTDWLMGRQEPQASMSHDLAPEYLVDDALHQLSGLREKTEAVERILKHIKSRRESAAAEVVVKFGAEQEKQEKQQRQS